MLHKPRLTIEQIQYLYIFGEPCSLRTAEPGSASRASDGFFQGRGNSEFYQEVAKRFFSRGETTVAKLHLTNSKLKGKHLSTKTLLGKYQISTSTGAKDPSVLHLPTPKLTILNAIVAPIFSERHILCRKLHVALEFRSIQSTFPANLCSYVPTFVNWLHLKNSKMTDVSINTRLVIVWKRGAACECQASRLGLQTGKCSLLYYNSRKQCLFPACFVFSADNRVYFYALRKSSISWMLCTEHQPLV